MISSLPQARRHHGAAIGERNGIRLLARACLLPLVKTVDRDETAPPFKCLAESRPGFDAFGLGVYFCESDLDVLCPMRDQAPTQQVETALASFDIVADDGQ